MNRLTTSLALLSLFLVGCSGAGNPNLWDKTFKSTGRTVVDYNVKLENGKTKRNFLKENYPNNINWDRNQTGVYLDYSQSYLMEFPSETQTNYDYFIDSINNWWLRDKLSPITPSFYQYKNIFDHITTITKHTGNNAGMVTFHSDIVPHRPTDTVFNAYDNSENLDGSLLMVRLPEHTEDVGYVRYTGYNDIVNIRNGENPDSVIEFRFTLKDSRDGIEVFSLFNYIEIKEYHYVLPWWAITLIVVGSLGLVYIIYLIIKRYRRYHHKY